MHVDVNMCNVGDVDAPPSKHTGCVRDLEPSESHGDAMVSSHTLIHGAGEGMRPAAALSTVPCTMTMQGAPDVSGSTTISQTVHSAIHDTGKMCADSVGGEHAAQELPEDDAVVSTTKRTSTVHGNSHVHYACNDHAVCSVCRSNRADQPYMGGAICNDCEMELAATSARLEDVATFFGQPEGGGYDTETTSVSSLTPLHAHLYRT